MTKPDFFIIGAPKSGTTSLYSYLKTHPNIFMSKTKEPNFFNQSYADVATQDSEQWKSYYHLFRKAKPSHKVVGEATVRYLFSSLAVEKIFDFNPASKLIIMVRNPVSMVQSFHNQQLYNLNEDQEDFETAWRLQSERKRGNRIPSMCAIPELLQYANVASLGKHVEKVLTIFPEEQVKVLFLEDMAKSAAALYADALSFLNVPNDGREKFPVANRNRKHRNHLLARFIKRPPAFLKLVQRGIKKTFQVQSTGLFVPLMKSNSKQFKRKAISEALRKEMVATFEDDISLLSRLTGRDLSHWLQDQSK